MIIEKKRIKVIYGHLALNKEHPFIKQMEHSFKVSPLLQIQTLEFAYQLPYDRAMKLLNTVLPRANMGASQAQRLMDYYGSSEELQNALEERGFAIENAKEVLYAQVDGGHLLTDDGYQETKIGRIFKGADIRMISSENQLVDKRNKIERSDYIAHLGHFKNFTSKFETLLDNHLEQGSYDLVLISDGAAWISNWQQQKYPKATMILDFYHAMEHLSNYAKLVFSSTANKHSWIDQCRQYFLKGQLDKVIQAIKEKSKHRRGVIQQKANKLAAYYDRNRFRMDYHLYQEKGYCIGSGAIESAVSTLAQQRCKLVGQRWTSKVQSVLNVRAIFMIAKKQKLLHLINHKMGTLRAA